MRARTVILTSLVVGVAALAAGMSARPPAQDKPMPSAPVSAKLTDQERRGENLFLQRCSLCHLPRKLKFGSPPVIGPTLAGQFKDATPEQMKTLRGFILKGGPDMPGFQYGLEPNEVDDLVAYLKKL